ncbi:unnamed protein product, partial [marine sediment metagenome]
MKDFDELYEQAVDNTLKRLLHDDSYLTLLK